MSPSVIGTAYIRNLYTRIYPDHVPEETAQADMSPVILVGRMSVPEELEEKFNKAYNTERLPEATKIPGYIRARRWEAVMGAPEYSTVHEMESMDVVNGDGWKAWSPMVTPVWNTEVRPHMVHEEGSPGYSAGFSRNDRRLNAIPSSFKGRGLSSSGDAYFTALTHAY